MKEFNHYYTLSPEWHHDFAKKMGTNVENDKLMIVPEVIGRGYSLFMEVIPGMSVLLLDLVLSAPIKIKRLQSSEDLRIIHFDLSDEVNSIQVQNSIYKIGYKVNRGLAVTSNDIENIHQHAIGKRIFTIRLIVEKKLLNSLIGLGIDKKCDKKNKFDKKALYFNDHIDSDSKILMHAIKGKSALSDSFDFYLKGIALKLFANFGNRYSLTAESHERNFVRKEDIAAFNLTKDYLLNNLKNIFPGVLFLAKMTKMSTTKYKTLFKKIENTTPSAFFSKEKMHLANKLLSSGHYSCINEILHELNYKRLDYFINRYFINFGKKPYEDFVSKKIEKV